MKAYTDIEQSKKLAEILPLESADMWYCPYPNEVDWYDEPRIGKAELLLNQLPCWSLAALLSVLPLECGIHKQTDGSLTYYYVEYPCKINKKYLFSKRHDNPIDACYEMILKLYEQKLL